jgi:flavin reductase (DIM6/NTAB) family NADH-FMN oxidoreductase RutF
MVAANRLQSRQTGVEHETLDPRELATRDVYRLMIDLVAPRPIAWVSTQGEDGRRNLAPFSYFQGVCSQPPTVVLGLSWRSDGRPKDTLRNIVATRELVINHVGEPLAEAMNLTSGDYEPDVEEWEVLARAGLPLTPVPAARVLPPRVGEAQASLECRLTHAIPMGRGRNGAPSATLVIAEVVLFTVARDLVERDERGAVRAIDPARLAAVGRLGGIAYTRTRETFRMPRPKVGGTTE